MIPLSPRNFSRTSFPFYLRCQPVLIDRKLPQSPHPRLPKNPSCFVALWLAGGIFLSPPILYKVSPTVAWKKVESRLESERFFLRTSLKSHDWGCGICKAKKRKISLGAKKAPFPTFATDELSHFLLKEKRQNYAILVFTARKSSTLLNYSWKIEY